MNTGAPSIAAVEDIPPGLSSDQAEYWFGLIDTPPAAAFLGLVERTLENYRQVGDGPPFIRVSARCIRYRRWDLKTWSDSRLRKSTSDPGPEVAAA